MCRSRPRTSRCTSSVRTTSRCWRSRSSCRRPCARTADGRRHAPSDLLPLPELALGIALGIDLVLEDAGDAVQPRPGRRRGLVVAGAAVADGAVFLERADALADPGGGLAALAHQH